MTFEEKIILFCAFEQVIGKETYQASAVYKEIKKRYSELSSEERAKYVERIDLHFNGLLLDGRHNESLRRIKWLFDSSRKRRIEVNNTKGWVEVDAILGDDGVYYSIPEMKEYHNVKIVD